MNPPESPKLWLLPGAGEAVIRNTSGTVLFSCYAPIDARPYVFDLCGCTIGTLGLTPSGKVETTYIASIKKVNAPSTRTIVLRVWDCPTPWEVEYLLGRALTGALLKHGSSVQHLDRDSAEYFFRVAGVCFDTRMVALRGAEDQPPNHLWDPSPLPY